MWPNEFRRLSSTEPKREATVSSHQSEHRFYVGAGLCAALAAGFFLRRRTDYHKRIMVVATASLMTAAFGRIVTMAHGHANVKLAFTLTSAPFDIAAFIRPSPGLVRSCSSQDRCVSHSRAPTPECFSLAG